MIINKFIWAMAVFSAILALVIGSGFTALEYVKEPPAALMLFPRRKPPGSSLGASCRNGIPRAAD
ncbi:Uncharacterised protein [Neisseria gonorrhoeae]|uniref:Uncharacterized protein n=1 Tax=Neisseria gonorrhoeae TaxID=485 RepID=A0A378VWA0_NEIGO|nr:Uncharacterised protein [Neisseria gonorrhoeae]